MTCNSSRSGRSASSLLSGFHQKGSVFEYYDALMMKTCQLTTNPMAKADQVAIFVKGLKPKLRTLVL